MDTNGRNKLKKRSVSIEIEVKKTREKKTKEIEKLNKLRTKSKCTIR